MRKATLHISNNQASVSITMPSSPQHKSQSGSRRKDSSSEQPLMQATTPQGLSSVGQTLFASSDPTKHQHSLTSPRSPSPLYDSELLSTSNQATSSFRYPSQPFVNTQAALSSAPSTTMSNAHFQQQAIQQSGPNPQAQTLKSQQDIEEQYFATIESSALVHNALQRERQKGGNSRKPKLLRQAHAELMELPARVTRDRLPSATPSSFSNYSGTCAFSANYTAGLTPPFSANPGGYFDQAPGSSSFGERGAGTGASNYYNYFEDANSFVAKSASATAAAATQLSNNPNLRNLSFISNSQSSQTHPAANAPAPTDIRNLTIRDQQQNSMNTGRLATELSQNEVDSSFEYLSRLSLRSRSVPLLAIYIKNEPDPPDEELNLDEPTSTKQESKQTQSSDKELITFIDFLNENSTSTEKIDQIKEQSSPTNPQDSDVRLEKISSSDEDGYADVESVSEIMNFSNRQQTVIKRDKRERHSVDIVKEERPGEKADFLIASQFDKRAEEPKDQSSHLSDDGLELEEEDDDFGGNFEDSDELKLLPSTPSQYSLFQKLMNKHGGSKEAGSANQGTARKHSSDIESQSRPNASYHKHRHRRKKEDGSPLVPDDQSNPQQPTDQSSKQPKTSPSKPHKKHSKKIKDRSAGDHRSRNRSDEAGWSDMPNAELQHQQLKALMKSEHIQTSNSLPSSRSMQLCQANSFSEQANDPGYLISSGDQLRQLNMRSNSKDSVKSPKLEKKKRKFSRKALNLLKVKHFQKSKSEETGKELESLASKTLAAVCKARSYNYNLIKNMNEYNISQQSSVFNSANNSYEGYEETYHIINPGGGGVGPHQSSHFNPQQTHQCQHNAQYLQQLNKAAPGQLQSNAANSANNPAARGLFDPTQSGQPPMNNDPLINDDTRLFAVHLHNTDRKLKSSKGIVNPVVKIHVVNLITGEYVHTSDFVYQSSIGANAGTYLGSLQGKEYVQPLTTQPCDLLFKFRYPKNPSWEETVVFNESFDFLRQNDVILFFEILDYVRLEHSDLLSSFQLKHYSYRVAYGYFLLSNLQSQLDSQMIKLQLYKPYMHTVERTFDPYCQIFNWWKNYKRIQYPCSLFLTLTTVSIRELSNQKHPIHLRILNKGLTQQYINQRRALDYNEHNQNLIQQQQADFDQANQRQPQAAPNYQVRNLKQFQQVQTNNSSLEDQAEPQHPPYQQAMAMPSGHLHSSAAQQQQSFHQTSLPSGQPPSTQAAMAAARNQSTSVLSNWNKSSGGSTNSQQHCKLPSSTWHQLSAGNNKCCYNVAFSNDGSKIACCASVFTAYMSNETRRSSIFIYDLPAGTFLQRVNGFHSAPIYYLDWSKNDKLLASASADCTCLVWQMRRAHCAPLCLTHPCFVYTVKFHPTNHYQLATGAFDGAVRLWCIQESLKSTIKEPILLQCVAATGSVAAATFHGQVLALCWMHCLVDYIGPNGPEQKNELLLFSGCSRGNLMALKQDELSLSWQPSKKMKIKEITNIAINEIQCCPNDSRFIILFCRDGVQRMVDIFSETITMRYIGSLNFNHLIRGCLSTDGKFLFAGSEDAIVHVWNVDTGERIYTYNNLPFRGSIASISYHPHDDIIAISGLNARTISVCLYKHHSRELPSPKPKHGSDPNYLQSASSAAASSQPIAKASMVTSNPSGHTTVSFARDEYKQDEYMMTNKSVGSLATERTRLTKNKPELKKSHTIDHSSNSSSTSMPSKANQKVQKAMRKLELALRLSFNEKS